MDDAIKKAFRKHWKQREHTKSELEAFGAALNPAVELAAGDSTNKMVDACLAHIEAQGIEIKPLADPPNWQQVPNVVATDQAPGPAVEQHEHPQPEEPQQSPSPSVPRIDRERLAVCLTQLEELLRLPPAHQNYLSDSDRHRAQTGQRLIAETRAAAGLE